MDSISGLLFFVRILVSELNVSPEEFTVRDTEKMSYGSIFLKLRLVCKTLEENLTDNKLEKGAYIMGFPRVVTIYGKAMRFNRVYEDRGLIAYYLTRLHANFSVPWDLEMIRNRSYNSKLNAFNFPHARLLRAFSLPRILKLHKLFCFRRTMSTWFELFSVFKIPDHNEKNNILKTLVLKYLPYNWEQELCVSRIAIRFARARYFYGLHLLLTNTKHTKETIEEIIPYLYGVRMPVKLARIISKYTRNF